MATTGSTKTITALCALAALWVVVYWIWDASPPAPAAGTTLTAGQEPEVHWREVPRVDRPSTRPSARPSASFENTLVHTSTPSKTSTQAESSKTGSATPKTDTPRFAKHVVAHGETWSSIAKHYFGKKTHARALVRANPFKDPRALREGDTILIPSDPDNVQGMPIAASPDDDPGVYLTDAKDTDKAEQSQPASPAKVVAGRKHRVRKNEVLTGISLREYGSIRYAQAIFVRNKDRLGIKKVEHLRAGQVLLLPDLRTIQTERKLLLAQDPSE